jgi:hypothetical protein
MKVAGFFCIFEGMSRSLNTLINALGKHVNVFDKVSIDKKNEILNKISKCTFENNKSLILYYDMLQFLCAYPSNTKTLQLAEKELTRLTKFCQRAKNKGDAFFLNSGLPFSYILMGFSHDCLHWLLQHKYCKVSLDRYENPKFDLNDALRLTLPSLEMGETSAGLDNDELLESLMIKEKEKLPFILAQFDKFNKSPFAKDFLFEGLDIYVNITPTNKLFSKAYNRIQFDEVFLHPEIIKRFDHIALLNSPLPQPKSMDSIQLKTDIALTLRETDPTTFMDEKSFRLYELERGISIAIYGLVPNRQLPLESYVGYTLFKNGFQAAYGGGWVFGERSLFGINISESLRGGESSFILCQLLRVYRQAFGVNYFEVEPYQYGLDNPEGIQSGAFWFYYRYGFRPLDKKLAALAKNESIKIAAKKGYRSPAKLLEQFTESNIGMNLGDKVTVTVVEITKKVKRMIAVKFKGNRAEAENRCMINFQQKTGNTDYLNSDERQVLREVSLLAETLSITDKHKLNILVQMITTKPYDLYAYQNLLLEFLR